MTSKEEREHELKDLIIRSLALEEIRPDEIDSHAPLFGEGLGLDSIDALELMMAVQRKYGFKASEGTGFSRESLASVSALADFISTQVHRA